MAMAQYFVFIHSRQWKIGMSGQHYGPYATKEVAIRTAVNAAHCTGQCGNHAQVLVQDANNQFHIEWTYGRDAYPPPG